MRALPALLALLLLLGCASPAPPAGEAAGDRAARIKNQM